MTWQELLDTIVFSWPSLTVCSALAVGAGVVGLFVLLRRQSLAALAMPQAAAVGVALGLRTGTNTLPPALAALALLIALLAWPGASAYANNLLGACYVGGLSVSMLIIAGGGAHLIDLQNRFVGIDVAVWPSDAARVAPVLLAIGLIVAALWRRWLLMAQAPAAAELAGLRPARWELLFNALLAATVLMGTDTLGVVMVLAMLFLPAATVLPWVRRIPAAMVATVVLALLFLTIGTVLSIEMSWPLSQSVGGVGFIALVVSRIIHGLVA